MQPFWKLLVVLSFTAFLMDFGYSQLDDDDDDNDGIVEDEPDDTIIAEKQQYEPPRLPTKPHLAEPFLDAQSYKKKWSSSQAKKDGIDEEIAKYDGKWSVEEPKDSPLDGDLALVMKSKAKHHAVATKLDKTFQFSGKPFIVSYEVKFQNGIDCGGAYIKLLSKTNRVDLEAFHDKTPYTVMFGPDKCGLDYKLHFIFRHKNPKTGEYEEKHAKKPSGSLDKYFTDKKTHVYSLFINPDNSFEIYVDGKEVNSGNLLEDFSPPVNPPKEIDDPKDKKPEDWDEREKIADPDAKKPDDWDEDQPAEILDKDAVKPDGWLDDEEGLIPDPDADKPEDWDDEMDGEWEAALIDNPACRDAPGCGEWTQPMKANPLYKGKWVPPMIDNPNYKGVWKPKRIENPDFFEDTEPYKMTSIEALGLELWSMNDDIVFDNFLVTDDREIYASWVEQTWERKNAAELAATGLGILGTLTGAAKERPWLYAVYVVVLLLPIILLSICLCPRSGPVKEEDIKARKKTDEVTPDDEGAQEGEEDSSPGPAGDTASKQKKSKAALEKEEDAELEDGSQEEMEEGDSKDEPDSPRRSARKRKPRKD